MTDLWELEEEAIQYYKDGSYADLVDTVAKAFKGAGLYTKVVMGLYPPHTIYVAAEPIYHPQYCKVMVVIDEVGWWERLRGRPKYSIGLSKSLALFKPHATMDSIADIIAVAEWLLEPTPKD
jgi:hypothetical protein